MTQWETREETRELQVQTSQRVQQPREPLQVVQDAEISSERLKVRKTRTLIALPHRIVAEPRDHQVPQDPKTLVPVDGSCKIRFMVCKRDFQNKYTIFKTNWTDTNGDSVMN